MRYSSGASSLAIAIALFVAGPNCAGPDEVGSTNHTTQSKEATSKAEGSSPPSTTALTVSTEESQALQDSPESTEPETADPASVEVGPAPQTASELVEAMTRVERAIRSSDYTDQQQSEFGRRQQSLYRLLNFHPDWVEEVLASVPEDIALAAELNWTARENLQTLLATHALQDTMPAWQIVDPEPAVDLLSYYKEAERQTGIEWEYVAAINLIETRMGRIRGTSTAGAVGPMQFLPTTWAECCSGDPTNPRDAIVGAATYLTHRGGPENMAKAIWGYNNSDYYVNAVTAYANVLKENERAYFGYHGWGVYFLTTEGLIVINEGYEEALEIPVDEWLTRHPDSLVVD